MANEPAKTSEEIDSELLTAYLDGELSDTECITVENRLAEDPSFHGLMCELQGAWDMLDSLPLIQPNSHFVQTTVEMAIAGHDQNKKSSIIGKIIMTLMLLLVPATAMGMGYILTRESIERPERELVNDLPIVENHDRYSKVIFDNSPGNGIAFLKSIYAKGLFTEVDDLFPDDSREEPPNDFEPTSQPPDPQRVKDRNDRLSRMTDQERAELFEKKKKFEALAPQQQQTIREFHDLLAKDPERRKLVGVMSSYYDWLKILGMSQRANLLDLPLDKRLKEIRRITRRQARDAFGTIGSTKLPLDDAEQFYRWYDTSIHFYGLEIRTRAGEVFAKVFESNGRSVADLDVNNIKAGPLEQLVGFLMRHDRARLGELLCENTMTGNLGIEYLSSTVSDEARAIINQPGFTEGDRQELILKWIEAANRARFPIQRATLEEFHKELTQEQRDQLDNLHPDLWYDMLTRMYWKEKIGKRSAPSDDEDFRMYLRQNGFDAEFRTDDET